MKRKGKSGREKRTRIDNWFFVFCCITIILATITLQLTELGAFREAIKGTLATGTLLTFALYLLVRGGGRG